jgi:hypothetical protein
MAINSEIAIVVCRRRLRMRWAVYFETAAAGLSGADERTKGVSAGGAGATAGAVVSEGCDELTLMTGGVAAADAGAGAGFGGASAVAMTTEAEVDEMAPAGIGAGVVTRLAAGPWPPAGGESLAGVASPAAGMTKLAPQAGQMPRLPAKCSLTLSLCPFGQEKRIPISRVCFHWRPL